MTDENENKFEVVAASDATTTTPRPCGCGGKSTSLNKELNPRHQELLAKFREGKFSEKNSAPQTINNNGASSEALHSEKPKRLFF
jgi:hypothetical protein